MLQSWPVPPGPDSEEAAERVLASLGSPVKSSKLSDEQLFSSPLPTEPGESSRLSSPQLVESKMSKERRSRGSFSDLAKLAGTPPPPAATPSASVTPPPAAVQRGAEAGSDDSGIVDF